jgi:hypothetical protein
LIAAAAAAVVLASSTMAGAAPSTPPDGAKAVKDALATAARQTSVHTKTVWKISGRQYTILADAAIGLGVQQATLTVGKSSGTVTIELVKKTVYFKGTQFALASLYNFSAKAAKAYANKWISVSVSDPHYSSYASGLDLPSVLSSLTMSGPFTVAKTTKSIGGIRCWGITGNLAQSGSPVSPAVLYVSDDKVNPLPVEQMSLSAPGTQGSLEVDLSNWSARVTVNPPASSVPIASVVSNANLTPRTLALLGTLRLVG